MRIVHTADWHVGRFWKNVSRLDEVALVLDYLTQFVETEKIDLLLVAGDLFDTTNPGADAEQLVFQFFRRLGASKIPAVVIAGNHDSPGRLDAYGTLADLAGVHIIGKPRSAAQGGVVEIAARSGEKALIAALPFAVPGAFASALGLTPPARIASDGTPDAVPHSRAIYADVFQQAARRLADSFRPDCVNVLMAHTHVEGAVLANSERPVHLGAEWTALPQTLPAEAQYVALGHIHKPQQMRSAPVPTLYAGSILQLDFGEAGQEKSFVVVDVHPGGLTQIERVPYEGGKDLVDLKLTLEELQLRQGEFRTSQWLRVTALVKAPVPDLVRKVQQIAPNSLVVRCEVEGSKDEGGRMKDGSCFQDSSFLLPPSSLGKRPLEIYRAYHQQTYHRLPEPAVEEAFQKLYQQSEE